MTKDALLPTVTLKTSVHRKSHQLLMCFEYNNGLIERVRKIPNVLWSATLRCWYVAYVEGSLDVVCTALEGVARVDTAALVGIEALRPIAEKKHERVLNEGQRALLNGYYRYLQGKRYSISTVRTYSYLVADFVEFCGGKGLEALTNRDVELFIEGVLKCKSYSISTQRQFISAMKLFVALYPVVRIDGLELTRPKKSQSLPSVLSQEEVLELIRCTKNLKHRAIIALLYSCGLRVSELIHLKLADIDVDRRQVLVRNGKGRKDRYVSVADSFLPLLAAYYHSYKPTVYFVEGEKGKVYSAESVRQFLKRNAKLAKIGNVVTPHTLRHSYATHLLENGVDLRYIQSLLGHARPETTMIYTHVKRKDLMQISNPLDVALQNYKKGDIPNKNILISRNGSV